MAHNGGRMQVNLTGPLASGDVWAIDVMKMCNNHFEVISAADTDWPALLTPEGYPSKMAGSYWRIIPSIWGASGDTWDLVYPSQHTVDLISFVGNTITDITSGLGLPAGTKRFRLDGTAPWVTAYGEPYPTCSVSVRVHAMPTQNITGITRANPGVVTYSGSDTYANGDKVAIASVVGMTEVNGRMFTVANVNTGANTFELSGVDTSGYTAYSSGGTLTEWTGGIKLYRTDRKTLLDAGEIFEPEFLKRLGYTGTATDSPMGMVRFMDFQNTIINRMTTRDHRSKEDNLSWIEGNGASSARYCTGVATKTRNDYVMGSRFPGNPVAWTDGQVVQFHPVGDPTFKDVQSVTNGNPTTINCTAHGFTTGDKIFFIKTYPAADWTAVVYDKNPTTGLNPDFVVTVVNANSFTIPVNSTGFSSLGNPKVGWIVTLGDGTLPQKRCYKNGWEVHTNGGAWNLESGTGRDVVNGIYDAEYDAILFGDGETLLDMGVPIKTMCRLANKIGAHPWFAVPWAYDGADEIAYIQDVYDNLDSGLVPVFEKSNEIWNSGNWIFSAARAHCCKYFGTIDWASGAGDKHKTMAQNVATVFGVREYKTAIGVQAVGAMSTYTTTLFECQIASAGNPALYPINFTDILSPAPYITPNHLYYSNAADYPGYQTAINNYKSGNYNESYDWFRDELLHGVAQTGFPQQQPIDQWIDFYMPRWLAGRDDYTGRQGNGLEVWCYEGGHHIFGAERMDGGFPVNGISVADVQAWLHDYLRSQQHANVMFYYWQKMYNIGVRFPSQLSNNGTWDSTHCWATWPNNYMDAAQIPVGLAMERFNAGYNRFSATTT